MQSLMIHVANDLKKLPDPSNILICLFLCITSEKKYFRWLRLNRLGSGFVHHRHDGCFSFFSCNVMSSGRQIIGTVAWLELKPIFPYL